MSSLIEKLQGTREIVDLEVVGSAFPSSKATDSRLRPWLRYTEGPSGSTIRRSLPR